MFTYAIWCFTQTLSQLVELTFIEFNFLEFSSGITCSAGIDNIFKLFCLNLRLYEEQVFGQRKVDSVYSAGIVTCCSLVGKFSGAALKNGHWS